MRLRHSNAPMTAPAMANTKPALVPVPCSCLHTTLNLGECHCYATMLLNPGPLQQGHLVNNHGPLRKELSGTVCYACHSAVPCLQFASCTKDVISVKRCAGTLTTSSRVCVNYKMRHSIPCWARKTANARPMKAARLPAAACPKPWRRHLQALHQPTQGGHTSGLSFDFFALLPASSWPSLV